MDYLIAFLEGMITFISPCLLPMLPVYISYFAGQEGEGSGSGTLLNAIGFVLGFTLVFVVLGAFAGTLGGFLMRYNKIVNLALGTIVILFGLNFMGLIRIPFLNTNRQLTSNISKSGFLSTMLFGMVFSVGWTPCVGAFLGSALMLAASGGETIKGIFMLLCFSLGLGIPFMLSAILINQLKSTFDLIKKHYRVINLISGGFLVLVGVMMATGLMGRLLSLLTF
ncbi:cytochrome c biogenesis CcdA family protein [Dehalobacterium formicoaceticum]|uniref:Cytochrome c biogenesis protein CcdA n=1 Tax=Dehalobacterium formicoaceticum TaxID=51515 RepID=A0ABT1Y3Z8_9FIRM|nr:cytochrome c biogenesis protein CcdA [Dehalobacterium formicoaceticum]MCR6545594.1 cytochrome c biogenesis protein CcdA [Dehalobacterium formicoaceticum]